MMLRLDEVLWWGAYFFGVLSGAGCGFVVGAAWRRHSLATRDKIAFAKLRHTGPLTQRLDKLSARMARDWAVGRNEP